MLHCVSAARQMPTRIVVDDRAQSCDGAIRRHQNRERAHTVPQATGRQVHEKADAGIAGRSLLADSKISESIPHHRLEKIRVKKIDDHVLP